MSSVIHTEPFVLIVIEIQFSSAFITCNLPMPTGLVVLGIEAIRMDGRHNHKQVLYLPWSLQLPTQATAKGE